MLQGCPVDLSRVLPPIIAWAVLPAIIPAAVKRAAEPRTKPRDSGFTVYNFKYRIEPYIRTSVSGPNPSPILAQTRGSSGSADQM